MSDLFDAQTKDQIESRMVQTLHTLTDTDKTAIEGSFARDMICLLYTSPSPRDRTRSRMPSSA